MTPDDLFSRTRLIIMLGLTLLTTAPSWAGAGRVVLDADGRTLDISSATSGDKVRIEVRNVSASQEDHFELRYRTLSGPGEATLLDPGDLKADRVSKGPLEFEIPLSGSKFVAYNLWLRTKDLLSDPKCAQLRTDQEAFEQEIKELQEQIDQTQVAKDIARINKELAELAECPGTDQMKKRLVEIEAEAADHRQKVEVYRQISVESSVDQIRLLFSEIDRLMEEKRRLEAEKKVVEDSCDKRKQDLLKERSSAQASLSNLQLEKDRAAKVKELEPIASKVDAGCNPSKVYEVKKMGLLVADRNSKVFYYGLKTLDKKSQPLSVNAMGAVPSLTHRDSMYLLLTNHIENVTGNNFKLTVTAESGSAINSELVRDVFAVASAQALGPEAFTGADTAFRDILLPAWKRFEPFDTPKVTLSTVISVRTKDETTTTNGTQQKVEKDEVMELKLLDQVEFPIVHGLYRYNFNTGVFLSGLRDSEFVKVKEADDDPSTADVNEARYRIDELEKGREVQAALAFTYYWKEVDILKPITAREALIPNPTLAFGVSNPQDNIFLGFSHSVARNVQLLWGVHRGKVTELKPRNDVSENQDATAPLTRQKSDNAFFVGLTFNLQVVSKIFK